MNPSPFLRNRFPETTSALFILLCAGLVIFGVAFFICFRQFESAKTNALNADNTAANLVATVLAEHEKASAGVLLSYADRSLLIDAVKEKDLAVVHSRMERMKWNNPEIDLIFLTDRDATIWANYPVYPEAIGQNMSDRDWYRGVSARWKPYTSTVFQLIVGDKPLAVATAVPVMDEKGEVIGILGNARRLDFMANTIQNTYLQPDTTVNVIDQKGQLLFSNKYSFRDKMTDYPLLPVVQQAIKENEHLIEATEPYVGDGKSYLTQYPVEHVGWTVVVERRHEAILRSAYRGFFEIGAIAILLFSLSAFFMFYHRKVVLLRKTEELLLTEQKLRKSEEKYLKTFQSYPACVGLSRLSDGLVIEANEVMLNVLGYSNNEFIGHTILELGVWNDLTDRERLLQTLAAEGRSVNQEYWLRTKNGELLLCNHSAELIQIDDMPHIIFTFFDITERKRAEEAIHESEARFRSVLDNSRDVIYRLNVQSGRYEYISPSCSQVIGFSPDELMAQGAESAMMMVHPDDRSVFTEAMKNLESTGEVELEYRQIGKDGNYRWLSNRVSRIRDGNGRPLYRSGNIRDITERKRAEEALRESRAKLKAAFASLTDAIFIADEEGRLIDFNEGFIRYHRFKNREECSRTIADCPRYLEAYFQDGTPAPTEMWAMPRALRGETASDVEYMMRRKDTDETWWGSYNFAPIKDEDSRIIGAVVAGREITDRKQAEAALKEAKESLEQRVRERTMELQELMEQLEKSRHELRKLASELVISEERERKRIAGVLHDEIAQTLATARMRLDLLQSIPSDQKDKQTLQDVKAFLVQSIQETRALMNDLGNPVLFDLGLKAACEALANRLMERHPVRIHCDIPDAYKHLDPDVKAIVFQVVRELLNNIAKHSQAQNARVMIDMEDGHFRVRVADDGVGFDPQTLGTPTDEGGFGLYSIRERLIAMNGSLKIESAPGTGTAVTAILPEPLD